MKTKTRYLIGLSLACLCVIVASIGSHSSALELVESSEWVAHTLEVRTELEKLSMLYMKAQNNIRGFFLTEQSFYLKQYQDARVLIAPTMEKIRRLTADSLEQQKELDFIIPSVATRMERWDEFIKVRKEKGLATVQAAMKGEKGKHFDVALHNSLMAMKKTEDDLFTQRTAKLQANSLSTRLIVIFSAVLALSFIGIAAVLIQRFLSSREKAEQELDNFFSLSLDLVCISGMDGYFKRLGPSFEEVLGFTLKELYSTSIFEFVHPDDRQRTIDEVEYQSKGNKVLSFENRFRCKDGSYRTLSWKSVPEGNFMYAVARDVTQQRINEQELLAANEAAKQGERIKAEFLANMSHEIRTPLNGIIGMTDIVSKSQLSTEQRQQIGVIRQSGLHLLKIINGILDFSKLESGQMSMEILDFNLAQLFASQISLIGVTAHEKNLKLTSLIDPKIPDMLRGDSSKVSQIILNLLGNAVKFTSAGSVTLKADLDSHDEGHCSVKFTVIDTGIGMDELQMNRLFRAFVQADGSTSRNYGGTGLGLSISKRLAEMMGGTIGVDSYPGEGSTFWFKLKFEVPKNSYQTLQPAPITATPFVAGGKQFKVLVAEDNFINQMIITKMLEKLGCVTHVVTNGQEAVNAFTDNDYDLIFMDYHMPLMDGTEATKHIRKLEEKTGKRVPILAFTANVFPEDQERCRSAGMDDFILKPVTFVTLEAQLGKWVMRA